jgi:FkbH-like protein/FkbM family methyltransferase
MTHSESTSVVKSPVSVSTRRLLEASAEFKVGVSSAPYLADHGFQDLTVLPGAFYIDLALRKERERSHRVPVCVRNVAFHNPIVLSAEDTVIKVEASHLDDGRVEYSFYEAGVKNGRVPPGTRQVAAKLEVETNPPSLGENSALAFSIEALQAQAEPGIGSNQFYGRLRANGNQYGTHFQNVAMIWRARDQVLGKLSVPRPNGSHVLHPCLLDSITQMLATFILAEGRTFVLRAIETIEIRTTDFPDTLWGHATLAAQDTPRPNPLPIGWEEGDRKRGLLGNVRVFDESGKPYLELSGVAFTLLDRVDTPDEKPPANLVIAANFTAEPLEDSLNFWSDHFGVPIHAEFAPYNQVFQQLLDAGSAFRRNSDGVNIILLRLEEWARSESPVGLVPDKERAERCFGNRARYVLPNGLEIVHLNQYETDYVYQEIFEDQCYLKHGIQLNDGDTVVDIGANIGLFSLFVMSRCKDPKVFAFEPAPVVFDLLKANCETHGRNVRAVNAGVSDKARTATFTFYEKSSVFSSFHADEAEDRAAIQTVVRNVLNGEATAGESVEEYVNELTTDRLRCQTHECQLISVSDIIRENQIERINLLKIDAEKSELDILKGIADVDWPKISQIVMEIHDRTGEAVQRIEELLCAKGFHCAVEHEKLLERSGLFNLYAVRNATIPSPFNGERAGVRGENDRDRSDAHKIFGPELETPHPSPLIPLPCDGRGKSRSQNLNASNQPSQNISGLQKTVREFCTALRSFAKQTTSPLLLCICPRSPNAEADTGLKAVLNEAEQTLLTEAATIPNVHTIGPAMLLQRYPVKDYYDPHGHDLGHIPYTSECYAAIGTALIRAIFDLKRRPFKVIVLDCDNTLWKGVCGEDGPQGIEISPPFHALQEFMIGQVNAGMLLCLCSKNSIKDVWDVFAQRTDLPLKREHLVSWRINWNSKSENLKSLSKELNLGLDSFIFLDDNPVECADVSINCPGVLTLQLPQDTESIPTFLNHLWAFDHSNSTEEDQKRTGMYQESVKRQLFREQSLSLNDYIKGLQLCVEIAEATDDQLGRVSQLTFRTNQFNFTTIRRTEKEVRDFLNRQGTHCLVVRVVDRFGDYGLVGVVMYETYPDRFKVDTFLLSCRVLGRGVEHAVVSHLGRRAVGEGKKFVELTCLPTEKNQPAREFIASIGEQYRNNGGASWILPAQRLASVEYNPDKAATFGREEKATDKPEQYTPRRGWGFDVADLPERLQRIGEELCDTSRLGKAISEYRLKKEAGQASLTPALSPSNGENALQTALLNIWRKVLGRPRIGLNDNFFEAGGTSLRAVQVIATIKKELKKTLSIVSLFECPTVALLAAKLDGTAAEAHPETATAVAALRGQQRRHRTVRRKAA